MPTLAVKEETGSRSTIIDNTFWTTYVVSESLAKLIILFPYNAIRSIINIFTSLMDYFFDMIKVMTDMIYAMIRPIWEAVKKIYYKLIDVFKKAMEQREAVQKPIESLPTQGEPDAVVNEADALLAAFEARELVKALEKRI